MHSVLIKEEFTAAQKLNGGLALSPVVASITKTTCAADLTVEVLRAQCNYDRGLPAHGVWK